MPISTRPTALPLRRWRHERGLSASQLAAELGVHPNSVLRWERGERAPGGREVQGMARVLARPVAEVSDCFQARRLEQPASRMRATGLRRLRRRRGLSAVEVAATLEVPVSTVYNWEGGRSGIPLDTLDALARLVDVPVESLERWLDAGPVVASPRDARNMSALRRIRRARGLSIAEVARRTGLRRAAISEWERGATPPLHAVRAMARCLRIDTARLARMMDIELPLALDPRAWDRVDLPLVLRTLRQWSGASRREVAAVAGVSENSMYGWETGRSLPNERSLRRLETAYRAPPGSLVRLG